MAQPNPYLEKMLEGVEKKIVDECAYSIAEIAEHRGCSLPHAGYIARQKVASDEWEKVWKRGTKFLIPAYRPKT